MDTPKKSRKSEKVTYLPIKRCTWSGAFLEAAYGATLKTVSNPNLIEIQRQRRRSQQ